jgi:adenine-specific DNA-methyltransferase
MSKKQKLELTWVGKENHPRLEPRILLEDPEKSYHAAHRVSEKDLFDNRLIFGDNLLALKALEQELMGKVKCVFIDPPYNTGAAFTHYDDGVEHSLWLTMMRGRLELLWQLIAPEGSLWITLDDTEHAYCKVLCDEIFGRDNFLANVVWEKADSPRMDADFFSTRHDNVLVYAKDRIITRITRVAASNDALAHYDRIDDEGRRYYTKPLRAMGGQGDTRVRFTLRSKTAPTVRGDGGAIRSKRSMRASIGSMGETDGRHTIESTLIQPSLDPLKRSGAMTRLGVIVRLRLSKRHSQLV